MHMVMLWLCMCVSDKVLLVMLPLQGHAYSYLVLFHVQDVVLFVSCLGVAWRHVPLKVRLFLLHAVHLFAPVC